MQKVCKIFLRITLVLLVLGSLATLEASLLGPLIEEYEGEQAGTGTAPIIPLIRRIQREELDYWIRLDDIQRKRKFEDLSNYARVNYLYRPEPAQVQAGIRPIVVVVVHGTGHVGTGGPATLDYFDITTRTFRNLLGFARTLANQERAPSVEVVSFEWSGVNDIAERRRAAEALSQLLNRQYPNHQIITIAHSHGGNVVNQASQGLQGNTVIDRMIHLAVPVRETLEPFYKPTHFRELVNFWSPDDFIQALGTVNFSQPLQLFQEGGSIRKYACQVGHTIKNIALQVDGNTSWHDWLGASLGHSKIEAVSIYLPEIFTKLREYTLFNDLDLNIALDKVPPILMAIRHEVDPTAISKAPLTPAATQTLVEEIKKSNEQRALYKKLYGKDMSSKSIPHTIAQAAGNALVAAPRAALSVFEYVCNLNR